MSGTLHLQRPFRVDYDCDCRQRATTHATLASALTSATEAVNAAERTRAAAHISYHGAGGGGSAEVTKDGVSSWVPEWFQEGQ